MAPAHADRIDVQSPCCFASRSRFVDFVGQLELRSFFRADSLSYMKFKLTYAVKLGGRRKFNPRKVSGVFFFDEFHKVQIRRSLKTT